MLTDRLRDRALFAALWLVLLTYWLVLAPPPPDDLLAEITHLALARTTSIDPIAIAIFNLLGVLPTAFLALLLFDTGKPNPWPFALGSYVLGGFILLPYLVVRDRRAPLEQSPGAFVRAIGSRLAGAILLALALALVGFAVLAGDPNTFAAQFRESQLIAVMSADLIMLSTALHWTAASDRQRRALQLSKPLARAVRLPLFGPLIYLAVRQPGESMRSL